MNEPIEQKELTPEELEALDNNSGVVAEETTEAEPTEETVEE